MGDLSGAAASLQAKHYRAYPILSYPLLREYASLFEKSQYIIRPNIGNKKTTTHQSSLWDTGRFDFKTSMKTIKSRIKTTKPTILPPLPYFKAFPGSATERSPPNGTARLIEVRHNSRNNRSFECNTFLILFFFTQYFLFF